MSAIYLKAQNLSDRFVEAIPRAQAYFREQGQDLSIEEIKKHTLLPDFLQSMVPIQTGELQAFSVEEVICL